MKVLITDHPWPDVSIEQSICTAAGHELIAGPIEALPSAAIDALVLEHEPNGIMCCWANVSAEAVRSAPDLRVVARLGVGLDNIAIAAATQRGAWVTNVPDYCVEEVSDHVIAMLLSHWRGITAFDRESKLGRWDPASANLVRTRNMTVGILGYGRIGQATARKLTRGFGARVLVTSPSLIRERVIGTEVAPGVLAASAELIQHEADAIVLHLPLTRATHHLVNDTFFQACRRKPVLINVSRGGLVDNDALVRALDRGLLSGAAIDVVEGEPSPPLAVIGRADVIATPHIAFASGASLEELRRRCTEDVMRVLRGEKPLHPCNAPAQLR
jgi:D-3-phosphoglycerate dehydrogenase / 2-oxoglutarate reductase